MARSAGHHGRTRERERESSESYFWECRDHVTPSLVLRAAVPLMPYGGQRCIGRGREQEQKVLQPEGRGLLLRLIFKGTTSNFHLFRKCG